MTTGTIQIRQATPADAEAIALFNEAMALETESRRLDARTIRDGVRAALLDPARGVYFLAESAETIVGQLLVTREWSDWRSGWFWWIQSVFVASTHRKAGVYRCLHESVKRAAQDAGDVCGLRLYVDADNVRAQAVYLRMGMTRTHYQLFEDDWSGVETRKSG